MSICLQTEKAKSHCKTSYLLDTITESVFVDTKQSNFV